MAGTIPGFDAAAVRDALRFAMRIGAPPEVADQATFHFRKTNVYLDGDDNEIPKPKTDRDGKPLDPNVRWELRGPDPITLQEVAVEFSPASADEKPVGNFRPTKATLTLLDEEYEQVKEAFEVELTGDRYVIGYEHPSIGLGPIGVHQLACFARQET